MKTLFTLSAATLFSAGSLVNAQTSGAAVKGDDKVKMKIIKIVDGDTTVIEKIVPRSELDKEQDNMMSMSGKNARMMMFMDTDEKGMHFDMDSLMKEMKVFHNGKASCQAFAFGNGMEDFKWESDLDSAMKSFHFQFNLDSMLGDAMAKAFSGKDIIIDSGEDLAKDGNGYSYNFNSDGKDSKVTVRASGKGKTIIINGDKDNVVVEEDKNGSANGNDDVVINITNSSNGKHKETRIIVRSKVKIEDMNDRKANKNALKIESLNFYPNPSTGKFQLEYEVDGKDPVTIKVTDVNGKEIYNEVVRGEGRQSKQIDLGSQTKGIYILNLTQGKRSTSKKIIVE